jgi:multimeric flavodoxin WrbA
MKVIAINGSPRKTWNTATLVAKAVEGAQSAGADAEVFQLYDLNYKGCTSCLQCKRKGYKTPGMCSMKDELTPVLKKIEACDVLILGSPIYMGNVTGEMRSFLERLLFPPLTYTPGYGTVYKGKVSSAFLYSMGMPEEGMAQTNYAGIFDAYQKRLTSLGGTSEYITVNDTLQFDDYSKYVATLFDAEHKAKVRAERFPKDCDRAFEIGARLATAGPI